MTELELPTYRDLMLPTLIALGRLGGEATNEAIDAEVAVVAELSDEQLAAEFAPHQTQTGTFVNHRLAWARTYLRKTGYLENVGRAQWRLTDDGRSLLELDTAEAVDLLVEADKAARKLGAAQPSDEPIVRSATDERLAPTYAVVRLWRDNSLVSGRSLFDPQAEVWTPTAALDLKQRIVDDPDESARTFNDKLADQLQGASQDVHMLAAEILYVHLLPVMNVGRARKLETINAIGGLAPTPFVVPDDLEQALGLGIVNGGAGYNTNRFWLVSLLIEFAVFWTQLSDEQRSARLGDPWKFKEMLVDLPQERSASQRNALLFMLFPDVFEDTVSTDHKNRIIKAHASLAGTDPDIDRQLLAVRAALRDEHGPDFSWYSPDVFSTWNAGAEARTPIRSGAGPYQQLDSLLPSPEMRSRFASTMAEAIDTANSLNPMSWSVSLRSGGVTLNVGPNRVLCIIPGAEGVIAMGEESALSDKLVGVGSETTTGELYSFPPESRFFATTSQQLMEVADVLQVEFLAAVRASAEQNSRSWRSFSEDAMVWLEEYSGRELPRMPQRDRADDSTVRSWIVHVKRDGRREVTEALADAVTRVFWPIDVPAGSSMDVIRNALRQNDPDLSNNSVGAQAGALHRFVTRMQLGDAILMPDGADIYLGTVTSTAEFDDQKLEWARSVDWVNEDAPIQRSEVSPELYSRLRSLLTVTEISQVGDEIRLLMDATGVDPSAVVRAAGPLQLPRIDSDLAREWMLHESWLNEIVDMLEEQRQLIFYGPPGTGKTYLAEKIAAHLTSDGGNFRIVQFHPSYSYEDFVEGFRPKVDDAGTLTYELQPGPLKGLADAAREDPTEPYILIIDEINRGNIAKIFGELYYLLEYRDHNLVLQYGSDASDEFSLPKNLFIVGTMNTADRSIAMVDAAIRRRFYFVEFSPTEGSIADLLRVWLKRNSLDDTPARLLDEMNRRLDDSDYSIGPSYLMKRGVGQVDELGRIWKHAIMPLLRDHFYGQPGAVDRFKLDALLQAVAPEPDESESSAELAEPEQHGDVDDDS